MESSNTFGQIFQVSEAGGVSNSKSRAWLNHNSYSESNVSIFILKRFCSRDVDSKVIFSFYRNNTFDTFEDLQTFQGPTGRFYTFLCLSDGLFFLLSVDLSAYYENQVLLLQKYKTGPINHKTLCFNFFEDRPTDRLSRPPI